MPRKKGVNITETPNKESSSFEALDSQRLNDEFWNTDKAIPVKINEDLTIKVNLYPTIEEKVAFIKKLVEISFIDDTDVYFVRVKAIFDVLYLLMFTNYQFPAATKNEQGQVDIDSAFNHLKEYNFDEIFKQSEPLKSELWKDCKQRIEAEKDKRIALLSHNYELEETAENINTLINAITVFFANASMKMADIKPESLNITPESINNVVSLFGGKQ
jgi:hypothetical protein